MPSYSFVALLSFLSLNFDFQEMTSIKGEPWNAITSGTDYLHWYTLAFFYSFKTLLQLIVKETCKNKYFKETIPVCIFYELHNRFIKGLFSGQKNHPKTFGFSLNW